MHLTNKAAERKLGMAMKGIELLLARLRVEAGLAPDEIIGRAIGSRLGGRTWIEHVEEVLESLLSQYRSRIGPTRLFERIIVALYIYGQWAGESRYPFHPSILRARCLLWIFSQVLTLEAKILSGCSSALMMFARGGYMRFERPSLLEMAASLFVPHPVITRATVDVIADAFSLFHTRNPPPPLLGAIFLILQNSTHLCFDYRMDGNLQSHKLELPPSNVFNEGALASSGARSSWQISCRQCLESVMSSGGVDLTVPSVNLSVVTGS
ncbi:uncharacterized protein B0H64DRAFT_134425 [Chaetomium fimeti]|uniref:Uncharacterized protein n=1 Tax=Chaetomium fimeti TaxID=1854472 RepID=A0AAE0HLN7_9PEZI|nr:hypothetical protein B0H64DRAFT_134425 [Chaetomium fimeti]